MEISGDVEGPMFGGIQGRRQQPWTCSTPTSTRRHYIPESGCPMLRQEALIQHLWPAAQSQEVCDFRVPRRNFWPPKFIYSTKFKSPGTELGTRELIRNKTKPTSLACSLILKSPLTGHRNNMYFLTLFPVRQPSSDPFDQAGERETEMEKREKRRLSLQRLCWLPIYLCCPSIHVSGIAPLLHTPV